MLKKAVSIFLTVVSAFILLVSCETYEFSRLSLSTDSELKKMLDEREAIKSSGVTFTGVKKNEMNCDGGCDYLYYFDFETHYEACTLCGKIKSTPEKHVPRLFRDKQKREYFDICSLGGKIYKRKETECKVCGATLTSEYSLIDPADYASELSEYLTEYYGDFTQKAETSYKGEDG